MMNTNQFKNIAPEKFKLVQNNSVIKDVKFDTKPVGFFKDAFMRFKKNKSSVTAAIIILVLVLFAIFAPIFARYETTDIDGYYRLALPKCEPLSFLGWDGAKVVDGQTEKFYNAFSSVGYEKREDSTNAPYSPIIRVEKEFVDERTDIKYYNYYLDTYLKVGFVYANLSNFNYILAQAYQAQTNTQIFFPMPQYYTAMQDANIWYRLEKSEYAAVASAAVKNQVVDAFVGTAAWQKDAGGTEIYGQYDPDYIGTKKIYNNQYFGTKIDGDNGEYTYYPYLESNSKLKLDAEGNVMFDTAIQNTYYSYAVKNQSGYRTRLLYNEYYRCLHSEFKYLNGYTEESILAEFENIKKISDPDDQKAAFDALISNIEVTKQGKYAQFLFGSNDKGKDIFALLGSGARLSFILAITVSAINLTLGAIYGSIEGYYGGTIDLVMERISDILSGVPFIVVATLFNLHLADKVGSLASLLFAFVSTGWIGMASRVRMQFYRFKGQEYILSARTLGASDGRIMFKHIFPNAIGTIITGSVLAIPGVIFSESSLSYLHIIDLETSSFSSIGTLLSNGSGYISDYPHVILFPSIFISLLMISFNLFGNGLRDAFNPSLRGADE